MLDDMKFERRGGGGWMLSRKTENYETKFNKIRKLSREQTLVASSYIFTYRNQN
jgi:hypothetical protein